MEGAQDEVTVRSPEGVELALPIAGPAPRIAAYAIDLVLVWIVMALLLFLFALALPAGAWFGKWVATWQERASHASGDDAMLVLLPFLILIVVLQYFSELLYFGLWETATRGRTPGKYAVGLRVVGMEGQPVDAKSAMVRNLLRAVDVLPSGYAIGLVAVVASRYGQRLGDLAAGTLVIRTERVQKPPELVLPSELEPIALSREQLHKLGLPELTLARATLRRLQRASAEQRMALLTDAAHALTTRLALDPRAEPDPQRLLERLLLTAERRAGS